MNALLHEITEQPHALRDLARFYCDGEGAAILSSLPTHATTFLTGMGASFHAAAITALHLHALGRPAQALEATDLLNYSRVLKDRGGLLVYVSQSGASGEVPPILQALEDHVTLVAVSNDLDSLLARRAGFVLPLHAGPEALVATKTYVNSLALLWLLAHAWGGAPINRTREALTTVVERCEELVAHADATLEPWRETLDGATSLVFLGHGPHAFTARHAAMVVSEWAKLPALHASVGAFRHGLIESVDASMGIVIFAAPGPTHASALALADELATYGARVLLVEQGIARTQAAAARAALPVDEFLSPILDVIPVQLFADALARQRAVPPAFRYISKVVTRL